jgi:uncharacterized protein YlxP (DUF503 family)
MVIGILEIELLIPGNDSLKGKRMQIKRLLARIQNNFNVSVAEVDLQERKRHALIAAVHVGNDNRRVNRVLSNLISFTEGFRAVQILNYHLHLI